MFSSIRRGIDWWIGGLVEAVLRVVDVLGRRRKRLRLVPDGSDFLLVGPTPRARTPIRVVAGLEPPHVEPQEATQLLKGRSIDVELASEAVLVRSLDPLPAESRVYLEGIIRHQLERLTPWLPADTLHVSRVAPVGPADPRLVVTVAATAKSLHAAVIAALRAGGAKDVRLLFEGPAETFVIPIDAGAGEVLRRRKARRGLLLALALVALPTLASIGTLLFEAQATQAEIGSLQEAINARRRVLAAASGAQAPIAGREVAAMIARKREAPVAVLALEALSAALPDDTFVSEMRLLEGRVRISGVSKGVNQLIPLVEETPIFAEAAFSAPTTRLPGGQGDQFHIDAKWLGPAGVAK